MRRSAHYTDKIDDLITITVTYNFVSIMCWSNYALNNRVLMVTSSDCDICSMMGEKHDKTLNPASLISSSFVVV